MPEEFLPEDKDLPVRRGPSSAAAELRTANYEYVGAVPCPSCGRNVKGMQSPVSSTRILLNEDGSLHASCRDAGREPEPEPLPPVPTMEQQQEKLERLLGRK